MIHIHLLHETPVRLWSLSSRERLQRVLQREGVTKFSDDLAGIPANDSVLMLRGDRLYDNRILKNLVASRDVVLRRQETDAIMAAHVPAPNAHHARALFEESGTLENLPDVRVETPDTLCSGYDTKLRKLESPYILSVSPESRSSLEQKLFSSAYKGITDLITKWVWPLPARWVVGLCARLGIRPNHVTSLSYVLAVAVGFLFAYGHFGWGLLLGWMMTFLDTVDGKLARVTVTYTKFGYLFDHLLDLFHPPFWYLAWGLGLTVFAPGIPALSLSATIWLIFIGYIIGRLAEGTFGYWLGRFSIFIWRPIDSYSRLITARRNPCLILLTMGALLGRPDLGLVAVAVWTVLSALFLIVRLIMACYERLLSRPLRPWLTEVHSTPKEHSLAVRWFTS
jgi:phosphatidylglycerophosphate synthase